MTIFFYKKNFIVHKRKAYLRITVIYRMHKRERSHLLLTMAHQVTMSLCAENSVGGLISTVESGQVCSQLLMIASSSAAGLR